MPRILSRESENLFIGVVRAGAKSRRRYVVRIRSVPIYTQYRARMAAVPVIRLTVFVRILYSFTGRRWSRLLKEYILILHAVYMLLWT